VNLKYNEFFDENSYSLPRLANGYKGDELPKLSVPIFVPKPTPPTHSSSSNFPSSTHPALLNKHSRSVERGSDDGDNASMVSDLTGNEGGGSGRRSFQEGGKRNNSYTGGSGSGSARKMTRKSIFDTTQLAMNAGNIAGRNMLSGNMCEYIKEECVESGEVEQLKEQSCADQFALLGWQVNISVLSILFVSLFFLFSFAPCFLLYFIFSISLSILSFFV
jgi:hypothetical protein